MATTTSAFGRLLLVSVALCASIIILVLLSPSAHATGAWQDPALVEQGALTDVTFPSPESERGWAVGTGGTILTTADGGVSWTGQSSQTGESLHSVSFPSTAAGWAVGGDVILRTHDGGESWTPAAWTKPFETVALRSVSFSDADRGWIAGYCYVPGTWAGDPGYYAALILKTTDGGTTWDHQPTPWSDWRDVRLSKVLAVDALHVWALTDRGDLLATSDGGDTWSYQTYVSPYPSNPLYRVAFADIGFTDVDRGWAVGVAFGLSNPDATSNAITIFSTTDGGQTWRRQAEGTTTGRLLDIAVYRDAKHGWAVGVEGYGPASAPVVYMTEDGGASWTSQRPGGLYYPYAIAFRDLRHGCVVGDASDASGSKGCIQSYVDTEPSPGSTELPILPPPTSIAPANKPVIVLVGGLGSAYDGFGGVPGRLDVGDWAGVYEDLDPRYTVLVPPMHRNVTAESVMDSMGSIMVNARRLDVWLKDHLEPGSRVVLVGHSMGGLIARAFAYYAYGPMATSHAEVIGIYQIATPNRGAPVARLIQSCPPLWLVPDLHAVAIQQLAEDGGFITAFNTYIAPRTLVPTRHAVSDFFPVGLLGMSLTPPQSTLSRLLWDSLPLASDGLVSTNSGSYAPDGSDDGSLIVHALHGRGLMGLSDIWPNVDVMPPESGTSTAATLLPDLAKFIARASNTSPPPAPGSALPAASVTTSRSRAAITTDESDAPSPSDLDSAPAWKICEESELQLTSGSTKDVPFSVEDEAVISVATHTGAPSVTVLDSEGMPVECQTVIAEGRALCVVPHASGQHVARVGLSGAEVSGTVVHVDDGGPSELRVSAPSQVSAGSTFTVLGAIYEAGARRSGGLFTASIGADAVTLRDDGSSPDDVAADGVFSGRLTAPEPGVVDVEVCAAGTNSEGGSYSRIAHELVTVAADRARLSGSFTWRTTQGPSGKTDALLFDIGVHASEDCVLRLAGVVTSAGSPMAEPSTDVEMSAGVDAVVTLRVAAADLRRLDTSGGFTLSSVNVLDMTDDALASIDSATPDLTGTLTPSDVEHSACSVGVQGPVPTNAATIELAGVAASTITDIGGVEVSFDYGTTWYAAPEPDAGWGLDEMPWSCAFDLPEGDYGVVCRAIDEDGLPITGASGECSFTVDRTAPVTEAVLDNEGWCRTPVQVNLTASDALSGTASTEHRIDGGDMTTGTVVTVPAPADHSNDGEHVVEYRSTDAAGNVEVDRSVTVRIDTTPPRGDFSLDGGSIETTDAAVSADSAVADAHGPLNMRFSSDGKTTWSEWRPYASATTITIPNGLGTKRVHAQYRDVAGNVLELTDTIELVAPPDVTNPKVSADGAADGMWYRSAVTITLSATDSGSGVASITHVLDGVSTTTTGARAVVVVPALPNGTHTLNFHATDNATNSCLARSLRFKIDTVGPVTYGKNVTVRVRKVVSLRYRATDALSPSVWAPRIVVKNARGRVVKTFRSSATTSRRVGRWYTVKWRPKARGRYRYYVYAKDSAGNRERKVGSAKIVVR